MDVSKLNSSILRNLIRLTEEKDKLSAKLAKIEHEISRALSGDASPPAQKAAGARRGRPPKAKQAGVASEPQTKGKRGRPKGSKNVNGKAPRGRRGALGEQILGGLKSAPSEGISVPDLATKLNLRPESIHVWFSSTGKKYVGKEVEKVRPGTYRMASHEGRQPQA